MEQLKFIITEVNRLCGTDFNMISFDSLNRIRLIQALCDVLQLLGIGTNIYIVNDMELTVLKIMCCLRSIKYVPTSDITPLAFYNGLSMAQSNVIYPILEWLLSNQSKVKRRSYLAKFVEEIHIPKQEKVYPEVQNILKIYSKVIKYFWSAYNDNNVYKKTKEQTNELQLDIMKMNQDLNKLTQRIQVQKDKLNAVNRESLTLSAKMYRNVQLQKNNIAQQILEKRDLINQIEHEYMNMADKWSKKKFIVPQGNVLIELKEEVRVNKIKRDNQLRQELLEAKKLIMIIERILNGPVISSKNLKHSITILMSDVQKIMIEKVKFCATNEDQLGIFSSQADLVMNKKQHISDSVKELRDVIKHIDMIKNEKEAAVYNLIGSEILDADELKKFVSQLREKNIVYKKCRMQLQGLFSELGVAHRTLDVLKSIDSSVDDVLMNTPNTNFEKCENKFPDNIAEAKQQCKELYKDIHHLKRTAIEQRRELLEMRNRTHGISEQHVTTQQLFFKETSTEIHEINNLKEYVQETREKIEVHEIAWKNTSQDIQKCEYIFSRLLDDFVSNADDSTRETYLESLTKNLQRAKFAFEDVRRGLIDVLELKKNEREIMEFLKLTEAILVDKLKII